MDSQQFDRLTKLFAGPRSRRALLRGIAGAAAATALARAGLTDALAQDATDPTAPPVDFVAAAARLAAAAEGDAGGAEGAGAFAAAACTRNGQRCGRRNQPSCGTCCSGYAPKRPGVRQRRCSCRPDGVACQNNRPDQCCSGVCRGGRCRDYGGRCTFSNNVCNPEVNAGECNANPSCGCVGFGIAPDRGIVCVDFVRRPPQCAVCASNEDCVMAGLGTRCIQNADCCGGGLSACVTPCG